MWPTYEARDSPLSGGPSHCKSQCWSAEKMRKLFEIKISISKQLTWPNEMGILFKALHQTAPGRRCAKSLSFPGQAHTSFKAGWVDWPATGDNSQTGCKIWENSLSRKAAALIAWLLLPWLWLTIVCQLVSWLHWWQPPIPTALYWLWCISENCFTMKPPESQLLDSPATDNSLSEWQLAGSAENKYPLLPAWRTFMCHV